MEIHLRNTATHCTKWVLPFFFILFSAFSFSAWSQSKSITYSYTAPGSYTFTVPAGITSIKVEAWGAGAGGHNGGGVDRGGGGGAFAGSNSISVNPGDIIYITVGEGGTAANNGGQSFITKNEDATVIVRADGGGGANVQPGGTVANSIGDIRYKGGDGGTSNVSGGGGGGGGSAGRNSAGGNGGNTTNNNGGAGGAAGNNGGAAGGKGGNSDQGGAPGGVPGGGGGETGSSGSGSGKGGNGQILITVTFDCSTQNIWLGTTSNDWFTASNWCSGVPSTTTNVYVPSVGSVPNQPSINSGTANCRNIVIDGQLSITGSNTLNVYGNWTNNGTLNAASGSTVNFVGSSNNTLSGSATTTFGKLTINKGSSYQVSSTGSAFATQSDLTVSSGNLILLAYNADYAIGGNLNVPSGATLTHSVNWDSYGKSLNVSGNIDISGTFTYTARSTVRMVDAGTKSVKSSSPFSIFLLQTGNFSANSNLTINDNFWPMFGTGGNFYTNGQTVNANAGVLINGGAVNINGGTLNVSGGLIVGYGNAGTVNFTSGTLNTDQVIVGNGVAGTFNMSGSAVANITNYWTNNGTLNATGGQVNFIGSAQQTIGGTNASTFYNMKVNNSAGVSLSQDIAVSNTLDLTNGLVTTNANAVTINASGSATNYSASSYINGRLIRIFPNSTSGSLLYPTGKGGNYRPLNFNFTSGGANRSIAVEQFESAISGSLPFPELDLFTDRYWEITKSGGTNTTYGYKVTLDATGFSSVGVVEMVKKEGSSSSLTSNPTVSIGSNYTNTTAFNSFNGLTTGTGSGTNQFALTQVCKAAIAGAATSPICAESSSSSLGGSIRGTATGGIWSSSAGGVFSPNANTLNAKWTPPAGYSGTAVLTLTTTGGVCDDKSSSKNQVVNALPILTMSADYCSATNNEVTVKGVANQNISTFTWSPSLTALNTGTSSTAKTTSANTYKLSATSTSTGCIAKDSVIVNIGPQTNLITNGNFESGNTGFTAPGYVLGTPGTGSGKGLWDEGTYAVNKNPQAYHTQFWGKDHTKQDGTGNFLLVNIGEGISGAPSNTAPFYKTTVTVTPYTDYYFSGWGVSLNSSTSNTTISANINGSSIVVSSTLPSKPNNNNIGTWVQFYATWNSGSNTSAEITLNNTYTGSDGRDIGIDDLVFSKASTYLNRTSASGTDNQTLCANSNINTITYEYGGDGNIPNVSGLPAGVSTVWNGTILSIIGTPTTSGNYPYTVNQGAAGCNKQTLSGTINAVLPTVKPILYGGVSETSICYQGSGSVTMTNSGSVVGNITWETAPGPLGSWTTVPNNNYTTLESSVYYRVRAKRTEQGCLEEISNTAWLRLSNIWTGDANTTDWNTVGNWQDNKLPNNSCAVTYIKTSVGKLSPKITSGFVTVQDLKIELGKTLTLSGTATLQISGLISAPPGSVDLTAAAIEFTGTAPQTIPGKVFKDRTVKNFIVNNTNTASGVVINNGLGDTLNISGTLSFGINGRKLTTGDNLTLKSTAAGTANIGVLTVNNVISGSVLVERYITNHKAWHFFSAPTKGSTFNQAWQAGNIPGINNNNRSGYGTMLTGTTGKVGYDYVSPQSSLRFFDNVSNSYKEIGNTLTALVDDYKGYMVFVRGDRSVKPTDPGYSATTLYTKGILYTPAASLPPINTPAGKWELIGNPFASAIDFAQFQVSIGGSATSLGSYYIWDPNLTSGPSLYGLGAFRTISGNTATPSGGNYVNGSIPPIQSGQAFFVKNPSAISTMTITIPESAKVTGSNLLTFAPNHKSSVSPLPDEMASIRANLYRVMPDNTTALLDGTIVLYHTAYSDDLDEWDAEKMTNPNSENMGMISHGKVLAIERKNLPKETDSILYKMNDYKIASYRFEFDGDGFDVTGLEAFLWDKFLNTTTPIPSNGTVYYNFDIKRDPPGSWDERRFSIFFKPSAVIPVTLTNVKAYTQNKDVMVEWTAATESNMKSYTVETSLDGKTFSIGGTLAAKNIDGTVYHWLDVAPVAGYHYYRILSTGLDGKVSYSKIVSALVGGNAKSSISIYPNPIKDGVMNVQFENKDAGMYQLRVLNTVGQVMMTNTINHTGGNGSQQVKLPSTLVKGVYQVEVWKGSERVMSEKVVY